MYLHCSGPLANTSLQSINIQAYAAKAVDQMIGPPVQYRVNASDRYIMRLPIEKYIAAAHEEESYKLLTKV